MTSGGPAARRRALSGAIALAVALGAGAFAASPAVAATTIDVASLADLTTAAASCGSDLVTPVPIRVTQPISAPTDELLLACSVDLDLNGQAVTVRRVAVRGSQLTIDDSSAGGDGSLTAHTSVDGEAGISLFDDTARALVVNAGHVDASGGACAAGIGGDTGLTTAGVTTVTGNGGRVTVNGGTVRAVSSDAEPYWWQPDPVSGRVTLTTCFGGAAIGSGGESSQLGDSGAFTLNGGVVTALTGGGGAAIGGGYGGNLGWVRINGGELHVTGYNSNLIATLPLIGPGPLGGVGGVLGSGGIQITGGTLTADDGSGFARGAAIGQPTYPAALPSLPYGALPITITGGDLTLSGGGRGIGGPKSTVAISGAATIDISDQGGGISGSSIAIQGGSVSIRRATTGIEVLDCTAATGLSIADGVTVSVTAPVGGTAAASDCTTPGSGAIDVAGDLIAGGGNVVSPYDGGLTVESTGRILGADPATGDPTAGSAVTGAAVVNHGVIAQAAALVTAPVSDENHLVTFDRLADGSTAVRAFASTFARGFRTVPAPTLGTTWNTAADGSGTGFDASTALSADLTLHEVVDRLTITATATSIDQHQGLDFVVTGTDALGHAVDTSAAVLTSDWPQDVVSGRHIDFPHASVHTITATLGAATVSMVVTVNPVADPSISALANTGVEPAPVLLLALGLLLAGAAALGLRRRLRRG